MADFELNVKVNGLEQTVSTIGQLEEALKATNAELAKAEVNSDAFNQLSAQSKKIEASLSEVTQDASQLNTQLKTVAQTTTTLGSTFQQTADAAAQIGVQPGVQNLTQNINQSVNSADSLRAQLRATVQELQNLEPGTARFQQLSVRAGELRDQIADTNAVVGALAGNATERLGAALSGVVNIGITGMQGVVGAMKLFGSESEQTREIMEKLQGLLFFTQAIQGLGGLGDAITQIRAGFSSLTSARAADLAVQEASIEADSAETVTTGINTAVQTNNTNATRAHTGAVLTDTTATEGATVATRGFTAALAANPIGLVVVGLTALIGALFLFSGGQKTAKTSIDETSKSLNAQAQSQKKYADDLAEVVMLRRKLAALEIADSSKRAKELKKIDDDYLLNRKTNLDAEIAALQKGFDKQGKEFTKYIETFKKYDSIITDYGSAVDIEKITINVGEKQLKAITDGYNKQKAKIEKETADQLKIAGLSADQKVVIQREGDLKLTQQQTKYYITYLQAQLKFLKQSEEDDKKAKADNIITLIKTLREQRNLLESAYQQQVKLLADSNIKKKEEEDKANEEAAEKRKAALEKARENYKRAYDEIVKTVKDANKQLNDIEKTRGEELNKLRLDQTTSQLDNIDYELKLEQDKVKEIAKLSLDQLNKSVLFNKKKGQLTAEGAKAEQDINKNLQEALDALNTFYFEKRKLTADEEAKLNKEKADKLLLINQILQKEINFGDQSTADAKESLIQRELELQAQVLEFNRKNREDDNADAQLKYREYLQKRQELLVGYYDQEGNFIKGALQIRRDIELAEADAEGLRRIKNFEDLLEKEFGATELAKQKLYAMERTKLEESLKNKEISEEEYQKKLEELNKTGDSALFQAKTNTEQDIAVKRKEINEKYRQEEVTANKKSEDDLLAYRLALLEKWTKFSTDALNQVLGLFQAISDLQQVELDNQLIDLKLANEQRLEELNTSYNDQVAAQQALLEQGVISQETYNARIAELDASRTSNAEKLAQKQRDKELAIKKKAFEDDKKLRTASAIIAGIQGAVSAFTGAFTSIPNPIAAAVVGGIFAALVAATTGVQVAAIQKQKFDSSGTTQITSPTTADVGSGAASAAIQTSSAGGFTAFNQNLTGAGQTTTQTTTATTGGMQRVYVLESDITDAQNRVRVLENNSSFG